MAEEGKGIALVILGVVAIIAVIGLVLLFSQTSSTGALFTRATGGTDICPFPTSVGEPQWFPVLAGPAEDRAFLAQWVNAGYECVESPSIDEYGFNTWCCRNPSTLPVSERGPVSLTTRRGRGVPVSTELPSRIGP